MNDPAEAYVIMAKKIAEHTITNRNGAILWWKDEAPHRAKYGVTKAQENEIAAILARRFPRCQEA